MAITVPGATANKMRADSHHGHLMSYSGSGVGGGYSPGDLQSAYGLPNDSSGTGHTIAIVAAYDDPNAELDLARYRDAYGLPPCTFKNGCFTKVNQYGGFEYPAPNAQWAFEISLDLDMASSACPNCHILLVEASSNFFPDLMQAEKEAILLGADVISNSWGAPEFFSQTSLDAEFNHQGVPITAASGDNGYGLIYPAASQYVISVGGTYLERSTAPRGWAERTWAGTGSGCSSYETKPVWQFDTGCPRRVGNDIAAVASPETPVSVADSYSPPSEVASGWSLAGGTSASAPLVAGILARSGPYVHNTGAEAFYLNPTGFNDVTEGSNGTCSPAYLCTANAGYDAPTGVGTPRGIPSERLPNGPSPTVIRDSTTGNQWIYYQGYDDSIWGLAWTGSSWTPPQKVGGSLAGGTSPAVVRNATSGSQWMYYQSSDGAIWGLATTSSGWGPPQKIGGNVAGATSPVVLRDPSTGNQWIYYQGSDRAIWGLALTGSGWGAPQRIGGTAAPGTSPAVIRDPSTGNQWIYYQGSDDAIWGFAWMGSSWTPAQRIGGDAAFATSPAVLRDSTTGNQWIYYQGLDGAIWGLAWTGSSWTPAQRLGGSASPGSSPTVIRDQASGKQWLYYEGRDGAISSFSWNGSKWTPQILGGTATPGSTPTVVRDASENQWLYYLNRERVVWGFAKTSSGWSPPQLIP